MKSIDIHIDVQRCVMVKKKKMTAWIIIILVSYITTYESGWDLKLDFCVFRAWKKKIKYVLRYAEERLMNSHYDEYRITDSPLSQIILGMSQTRCDDLSELASEMCKVPVEDNLSISEHPELLLWYWIKNRESGIWAFVPLQPINVNTTVVSSELLGLYVT